MELKEDAHMKQRGHVFNPLVLTFLAATNEQIEFASSSFNLPPNMYVSPGLRMPSVNYHNVKGRRIKRTPIISEKSALAVVMARSRGRSDDGLWGEETRPNRTPAARYLQGLRRPAGRPAGR